MTSYRKRLRPDEAEYLGLPQKPKTLQGNAKYSLSEDQWETVRQLRENKSIVKVLVYDIETAPLMSYVWGAWNQNPGTNMSMVQSDWYVITWSAKWLFEDKVYSDKLTPEEALKQDDERIVKSFWDLMNEADVVIGHNVKKFDNKRMNTRFLKHGLSAPSPYQTIDTLTHCKRKFNLTSNKLDYIAQYLGIGKKFDTGGFELWDKCFRGDPKALKKMERYNIEDVKLTEEVYLRVRSFISPHPNIGIHIGQDIKTCPTCGSHNLVEDGRYCTSSNVYTSYRCNSCMSWGRSRTSLIKAKDNQNLLLPISK